MAGDDDWIPGPMDEFRKFADKFYSKAFANKLVWHLIPTPINDMMALVSTFDDFHDISKYKASRTPTDTANTIKARGFLEAAIRTMGIEEMKHNTFMTDADREDIGVTIDSTTRTKSTASETSPQALAKKLGELGAKWMFTPKALPEGQQSIVVKIGFYLNTKESPEPVEEDCTQTNFFSKEPNTFVFPASKKTMYYVAYIRYLSTNKELGLVATVVYGVVN